MSKHFVDAQGNYLGAFVGPADKPDEIEVPKDAIEVPAPAHGAQRWDGTRWIGDRPPRPKTASDEIEELKTRLNALERGTRT